MADGIEPAPTSPPKKWSLFRAALYGAALSIPLDLITLFSGAPLPQGVAENEYAGFIAMVVAGRAFVFALIGIFIAGVRNLLVHLTSR